jgi:hypothetical protein
MVASSWLPYCLLLLAPSQTRPAPDLSLSPKLKRHQELVYRGSFREESVGGGVAFESAYSFEGRVLVLDTQPTSTEAAILTVLRDRPPAGSLRVSRKPAAGRPDFCSARLDRVSLDNRGQLKSLAGTRFFVPLEGPPTLEVGFFVPMPARVTVGSTWTSPDPGRPDRLWKAIALETVQGMRCLKLEGIQKSPHWDRPRADRSAWRRTDRVWLATIEGIAQRVERTIEVRLPARDKPTQVSTFRYELESSLSYPTRLVEDRLQDIRQASRFQQIAGPLFAAPTRHGRELEALLGQVSAHLERGTPTPYRPALEQIRRRVELARKGEVPPPLDGGDEASDSAPARLSIGQAAPDFVVPEYLPGEKISPAKTPPSPTGYARPLTPPPSRQTTLTRLSKWKGRPILAFFFHPRSDTLPQMSQFVLALRQEFPRLVILGLAMSDDAALVENKRVALGLDFPLLNGTGLRASYEVECTPRIILIDEDGVVRGIQVGWGDETGPAVRAVLGKIAR